MIRAGTCGFCKGHAKYYQDFDAMEVQQTFYRILREQTLERWRKESPGATIACMGATRTGG
ncbi:DUF72 domain-containing protein [Thermococcus sp. 18S1]|uniref:DUF72 domain-containing protein n=1 Tax=Thermococcus sp. 18S1 TaxID=1638210 RepID=UPI0037444372